MVEVFGEKISEIDYQIRKCVYAVVFNPKRDKVMTVKNGKGHYHLPGGGTENGESHDKCLEREMLEETGYKAIIGPYIGNAMRYFKSTKDEQILSDAYFYLADLSKKIVEPIEDDLDLEWISIESSKQLLIHDHHFWAVKKGLNRQF